MLNSIRKSKTTKGLVGLLSPLMLASGIYFSTPRFSHADPVSDFIEEKIDQIIDSVVNDLTGGKHKTYKDAIKDITQEDEEEIEKKTEQKKEPTGILYLKDGSTIKNVKYKDKEFTFTKDGQKLKIAKEKVLVIDFSKEKNKDILYLRDGSTIKNVQYQSKNLEIQSYLGDMQIDQDKIKVLIFGKQQETTPKKETPKPSKEMPKTERSETLEYRVVKTERLTHNSTYDGHASWSPDSKKIVFTSERDGRSEIYTMNADGTDVKRLTNDTTYDISSFWSPNRKIVFTSARDGNNEIYIMNSDGTNVKRLTNNPASDGNSVSSSCGTKIAFASKRDGNLEIYIMNVDGTNVKRLTNNPGIDLPHSWSTDGKKIVFVSDRDGVVPDKDGKLEIYTMDADGTNVKRLTHNKSYDGLPSLSPDGKKIAFASERDGNLDIYIMNVDGTNVKRLTNHSPKYSSTPSWSPNGKKILFESNRDDGKPEIYVMHLDTTAEEPKPSIDTRKPVLTKDEVVSIFEKKLNENEVKYELASKDIKFEQGKFTTSGEPEAIVSLRDESQCHANASAEVWLLKHKNGKWEIDRKLAENDYVSFETVDIQRDGKLEILIREGGGNQGYYANADTLISIDGRTINILYSNNGWDYMGAGKEGEAVKEYMIKFFDTDKDKTLELIETERTDTYAWKGEKSNYDNYKKISSKSKETIYKLKGNKYVSTKDKSETSQINKGTVNELKTLLSLEDTIKKNKYVAVNLSATWCPPCREYDPVFEELAKEYEDITFCSITDGKIDSDRKEIEKINNKYKIKGIPAFILFKDGKEVCKKSGYDSKTKEDHKKVIDDYLKKK